MPTLGRRGKVPLTVYVSRADWEQFRMLVIKRRSSNQAVLLAAVQALLEGDPATSEGQPVPKPPPPPAAQPVLIPSVPPRAHWPAADLALLRRLIGERGGDRAGPFDARGGVIAQFMQQQTGAPRTRKAVIHQIGIIRREMQARQ